MTDCGKINNLPSPAVEYVEAVLHTAHVVMASLIRGAENEYQQATWLGHFDSRVASAALEAKWGATRAALFRAIGVHASVMCVRLAQLPGEARERVGKVQVAASKHFPGLVEWPAAAADSGTTSALP